MKFINPYIQNSRNKMVLVPPHFPLCHPQFGLIFELVTQWIEQFYISHKKQNMQRKRESVPLALSFGGKGLLWRPEVLLSLLSHGTTAFWTTGLISESINGKESGTRMITLMSP